jgi:hypothetical protein
MPIRLSAPHDVLSLSAPTRPREFACVGQGPHRLPWRRSVLSIARRLSSTARRSPSHSRLVGIGLPSPRHVGGQTSTRRVRPRPPGPDQVHQPARARPRPPYRGRARSNARPNQDGVSNVAPRWAQRRRHRRTPRRASFTGSPHSVQVPVRSQRIKEPPCKGASCRCPRARRCGSGRRSSAVP